MEGRFFRLREWWGFFLFWCVHPCMHGWRDGMVCTAIITIVALRCFWIKGSWDEPLLCCDVIWWRFCLIIVCRVWYRECDVERRQCREKITCKCMYICSRYGMGELINLARNWKLEIGSLSVSTSFSLDHVDIYIYILLSICLVFCGEMVRF